MKELLEDVIKVLEYNLLLDKPCRISLPVYHAAGMQKEDDDPVGWVNKQTEDILSRVKKEVEDEK